MEQTSLSTKTKIVAWCLIVIGVVLSLPVLFLGLGQAKTYGGHLAVFGIFGCFVIFLGTILPGCLLLLRKLNWWYGFYSIIIMLAAIIGIFLTFVF